LLALVSVTGPRKGAGKHWFGFRLRLWLGDGCPRRLELPARLHGLRGPLRDRIRHGQSQQRAYLFLRSAQRCQQFAAIAHHGRENGAVNDLSLDICSGEFLALLGSSGSGKSTLLNLMAGLDRPTSGAINVRGQNLAALDSQGLARYRRETVGMVFQSFNLLPRMTLEENVELPLRLAEVDRAERSRRVVQALERVRLGEFPSRGWA